MNRPTKSDSLFLAALKNRRETLGSAGRIAAGAALASVLGPRLTWADAAGGVEIGMRAFTVFWPGGDGVKFDIDYYRDQHMDMMKTLFGTSLKRVELRKPIVAPGAPPSRFAGVVNFWVADPKAYAEASAKHGPTLVKDKEHFTNGDQIVQSDVVYGEAGKPASAIKVGDRCMTINYPHMDGDSFDFDYYRDHHLTSIMKLYGSEAISRYEMRKGLAPADGKRPLLYNCTVNIYVADQQAFAAGGQKYQPALANDVHNFSAVNPEAFSTEVYGAYDT
jgi:uncharacterized protein (TIGR02118 family)